MLPALHIRFQQTVKKHRAKTNSFSTEWSKCLAIIVYILNGNRSFPSLTFPWPWPILRTFCFVRPLNNCFNSFTNKGDCTVLNFSNRCFKAERWLLNKPIPGSSPFPLRRDKSHCIKYFGSNCSKTIGAQERFWR